MDATVDAPMEWVESIAPAGRPLAPNLRLNRCIDGRDDTCGFGPGLFFLLFRHAIRNNATTDLKYQRIDWKILAQSPNRV